jgi:hypothetical protein
MRDRARRYIEISNKHVLSKMTENKSSRSRTGSRKRTPSVSKLR